MKIMRKALAPVEERIEEISPDLPYELQSKMFDQLTGVGLAGAGVTITLIGSILRDAGPAVWIAAIEFGIGALLAVSGNVSLIDKLYQKQPTHRRSKIMTLVSVAFIGMGIGSLGMSVFLVGKQPTQSEAPKPAP